MFLAHRVSSRRDTHSRELAVSASVLAHGIVALLAVWVSTRPGALTTPAATSQQLHHRIWMPIFGPGGGGGGGGDNSKLAALAQQVGHDARTVPTLGFKPTLSEPARDVPPLQSVSIPLVPMAGATQAVPGLIEATQVSVATRGPGSGPGAGGGDGSGVDGGRGSGEGLGYQAGSGGGPHRVGTGVSAPQVIRDVKPGYTADAMRAKVQGVVLLECIVLADGSVGDVRVIKSLDKVFGLDTEAVNAVKQWRFIPGRRFGQAVAVLVTIELAFTLR